MRLTMADALRAVNAPCAGERAPDRGVGARSAGGAGWVGVGIIAAGRERAG